MIVNWSDKKVSLQLFCAVLVAMILSGCGATLPESSETAGRHLVSPTTAADENIPAPVESASMSGAPTAQANPQLYSVSAQDLPIRELLFSMARDASINIDIHPEVSGLVSLNAVDQTLPQILDRISRQIDMRWSIDRNGNLLVEPDKPYWRNYRVDYVNVERTASTQADVSNSLSGAGASAGQAGNSSSSNITQTTSNSFWASLLENINVLMAEDSPAAAADATAATVNNSIIVNKESGVVAIRAGEEKHREIQAFLSFVQSRALQQVLIEATVVEVSLNDNYQSGVDWAKLAQNGSDVSFVQNLNPANFVGPASPSNILTVTGSDINATLSVLSQFGDLQVLSSPKIMALNNQAAMLRVVDNKVYFTIEVEPGTLDDNGNLQTAPTFTSTVQTVPVGFVMNITPQIGENNQVTLNVRPTISRIVQYVNDPNPTLANAGVVNPVPEVQIREIESILKVYSGDIAVLGGLMQDSLETNVDGIPTLSRLPGLGRLFSYRKENAAKTELLVFIRPIVIRQASLEGDLREFKEYLPANGINFKSLDSEFGFQ